LRDQQSGNLDVGWGREASKSKRIVSDQDCALLDDIAARPECAMIDINPDWQT
jgi:hypothetical protein